MNKSGGSQVPGGVSGHTKAEKGPNPVIVKRRDEDSGGATCSENVCPCSFVQVVINVIDITVHIISQFLIFLISSPLFFSFFFLIIVQLLF